MGECGECGEAKTTLVGGQEGAYTGMERAKRGLLETQGWRRKRRCTDVLEEVMGQSVEVGASGRTIAHTMLAISDISWTGLSRAVRGEVAAVVAAVVAAEQSSAW